MLRKEGAIPPISGEKYPARLIVFDTEAYRGEVVEGVELQTLRLGVAHYLEFGEERELQKEEWFEFTTPEALVSYVDFHTRKDKALYIYAHNLKYDLQLSGLLSGLIGLGYKSSLFVIEDPPTFIRMRSGRKSIMMVDTFNYWQYSLKEMGEQLGTVKLLMPPVSAPNSDWFVYCKRDVEVLTGYLLNFIKFLRESDLAGLGLTLASQAFRSYRHRFMSTEVILHNRPEALALERSAYYGGRTDAFFIGEAEPQPFYKLDVNSMYPYVMQKERYPIELVGYSEELPLSRLPELLERYYVIADAELEPLAPVYPFVRGHKLVFPLGVFRTSLHHVELARALERGELRALKRIAIYHRGDVFSPYVDYFYSLKLKAERSGDKILRKQAKIFLNALYGKFGQREVISKIVDNTGEERYTRLTGYSESLAQRVEVNYLGNTIEVRYKGGESYYSSPAIAGAVTAYARVYLWSLIELAGVEHVYYMDTDSLIVTQEGFERLGSAIDPARLGALKLEGVSERLIIHSVKDYVYGAEVKVKGVPKSARALSARRWEYEQFRGAKTWIKEGMPTGVEVYTRIKERVSPYDKGIVLPSGRVVPLRLGEG